MSLQDPPKTKPSFMTIDRTHPDFQKYLLGELPNAQVALPIQSLHINSREEKITFQILNRDEVKKPSLLKVLARLMRLDLVGLTLLPVVTVFFEKSGILIEHASFALLSLLFLHGAIYCRNDFVDHLSGIDRLNEKGGSRVIQNGWIRAVTVRRLSRALLVLAVIFSLPVLVNSLNLVWLSALGGGIGIIGYSALRRGRELESGSRRTSANWIAGDLSLFFALGPLLTFGANIVAHDPLPFGRCALLGSGFGILAVSYVEIRHLISVVVDDVAGLRTLAVEFGFDRSKRFVACLFVLAGLCFTLFLVAMHWPWWVLAAALMLILNLGLAIRIWRTSSPLASSLPNILKETLIVHLICGIIVIGFAIL